LPRPWRWRFAGRYPFPRFQVDPQEPGPARDVRWPILVLGFCGLVIGTILLLLYAFLSAVASDALASCGGGSGSSPCGATIFEYLFLVPGLALIVCGALAVALVFLDIR
jgi:hypothetical protein